MRHGNRSSRLGVKTGHRVAMLRNLALGLIEHGRIRTTVARAKRLRPYIERLITKLKDPTVNNIRLANAELANRAATLTLAQDIATKFKDRPGGYTRILKLARARPGDNADMALIEWVEDSLVPAYSQTAAPAKKARGAKGNSGKGKASKKVSAKGKKEDDADAPEKKSAKKKA